MNFPDPGRRPTLAEMLGSSSEGGSTPAPAPKRRLTLAEMLKQSPLTRNTVPMAEAVEAAQAAKAEREAADEMQSPQPAAPQRDAAECDAPQCDTPQRDTPQRDTPQCDTPQRDTPQRDAAERDAAEQSSDKSVSDTGRRRYQLYARVEGKWIWQCGIDTAGHADGMRKVIAWLRPQHDALPIRLEQDEASVRGSVIGEAA